MSFDAENEFYVRGLAAAINARLAAQSRIAKAIAFGWICAGLASATMLCGLGVALALFGYSFTISLKASADETAEALVKALERADIKTTVSGNMSFPANSTLRLANNQLVKLEDGATAKLDPQSSIRVVGDLKIDAPQPSKQQLQLDATTGGNELPITNYVIFRNVSYGPGEVVTGWHYDLSDTMRPRMQFCYYTQNLERGLAAKYTVAIDGSPRRPSALAKLAFDFDGALANCIWFSGS